MSTGLPPGMQTVSAPPGMQGGPIASAPPESTDLPPGMQTVSIPPGMAGAPPNPAHDAQGLKPSPQATPHDFDAYIAKSAAKYGLDPALYRAVGLQETGLGTSPNFNPKTGLDRDSNQGHGVWQLDPASGATPDELSRAASDPQFAADHFAQMMSRNLSATHGSLRSALAMYNAGSPTSKIGLAYADQVLARMGSLDPMHIGSFHADPELKARLQWHAHNLGNALKNKKHPWQAVSHTPEMQPLTQAENDKKAAWHWLKQNPLEGIGDILSTGMREVQSLAPQILDPEEFHRAISNSDRAQQLRDFGNLVWHPTQQRQDQAQENFRRALNHRFGSLTGIQDLLRSNAELDSGVKAHVWKPLQHPAAAVAQTANDFIQQAIADPFTWVDLGADTVGRMAAHAVSPHVGPLMERALRGGAGVLRAVHSIMPPPVQSVFSHLQTWAQGAEDMARDTFGVRRDLDKAGFTREGKRLRMAIEGRHEARMNERVNTLNKYQHEEHGYEKFLEDHSDELTSLHGLAGRGRTGPTKFYNLMERVSDPAITDADRHGLVRAALIHQRNHDVLQDTNNLLSGNEKYFAGEPGALGELDMDRVSDVHAWAQARPKFQKAAVNIGKRAILYNSLPHGLINEGTLTFMAGGLHALANGIGAMAPLITDEQKAQRAKEILFLKEYGALPGHLINEFDAKNPLRAIDQAVLHQSQNVLEHMELGWRIGLMKTLEMELGPVTSEEDKLMRGWLINDKVGDYRNQNAFTHFFQGLGGPFTAFHLGIVPKAFLTTLYKHPGRIKEYQRLGQDLQNDADIKGVSDSSPIAEGAKFTAQLPALLKGELPSYVSDTLGDYRDFLDQNHDDEGFIEHPMKIAEHYFMPFQAAEGWHNIFSGDERANKEATLEERLMDAILYTLGKEYHKTKTPKSEGIEYKKIHRGGA